MEKVSNAEQASAEGVSPIEEGSSVSPQVPVKVTKKPVAETHPVEKPVSAQAPVKNAVADMKQLVFGEMSLLVQMKQQVKNCMANGLPPNKLPIFQQLKHDIYLLFGNHDMGLAVEIVKQQISVHDAIANQKLDSDKK